MAQTTGAMSMRNATIEYSTNNSDWTDISGVANAVNPSGHARMSGEAYTATGDTAIVTVGKREPLELDVSIVYTEIAAEAYLSLEPVFTAATAIKVRWSPSGADTGDYRYTSDTGYIVEMLPPGGEESDGGPILVGFKHRAPGYSKATVS